MKDAIWKTVYWYGSHKPHAFILCSLPFLQFNFILVYQIFFQNLHNSLSFMSHQINVGRQNHKLIVCIQNHGVHSSTKRWLSFSCNMCHCTWMTESFLGQRWIHFFLKRFTITQAHKWLWCWSSFDWLIKIVVHMLF